MEPSDILLHVALPAILAGPVIGINIGTFLNTREWLVSHRVDSYWDKKTYEDFRSSKPVVYYLGYPGRKIAYLIYSKRQ